MATKSKMLDSARPAKVSEGFFQGQRDSRVDRGARVAAPTARPVTEIDFGEMKPDSSQYAQPTTVDDSKPRTGRGGGPRTSRGKEKSRRNSLVHGIFAKVTLLDDEPPAQFKALLRGLRDDFQPVGTIENSLVEKLATLDWRYRRFLQAETAEIENEKKFSSRKLDREHQERAEAAMLAVSVTGRKYGLIEGVQNPVVLRRVLDHLMSLLGSIQLQGFDPDNDHKIIDAVFGDKRTCGFRGFYNLCSDPDRTSVSGVPEFKEFDLPPEARKAKFLRYLVRVIKDFKRHQESLEGLSEEKEKLESQSSGVPESGRLDRLLRYEASILREYDRVLNQLEQLQHARKGQPVLPTLRVNVATLN